ncbi:MAG: hypothetical protein IJH04_11450, partial [Eggerthellaceae bacterium]|nr:hypothetical protein [Eggerthellaceae bacterium]
MSKATGALSTAMSFVLAVGLCPSPALAASSDALDDGARLASSTLSSESYGDEGAAANVGRASTDRGMAAQSEVDKTALNDVISAAEALDSNDYYAATFALVAEPLAAAKALAADAEATQEDVDAAAEALSARLVEGAGGYLVKKSTVVNPTEDGDYKLNMVAYNASGYGTGTRTLAEFALTRQFDANVKLTKSGDELTVSLLYKPSSIDMQAVSINDVAGTKTVYNVADLTGADDAAVHDPEAYYEFVMPVSDISADNKLSFSYDTGNPRFGVMTSSTYMIAQGLEEWTGYTVDPQPDPYGIEEGKTYTANVTWTDPEDGHDVTRSMAAATTDGKVQIAKNSDGTYNVTLVPSSAMVDGMKYPVGTTLTAQDGGYTVTVANLDDAILLRAVISASPHGGYTENMHIDATSIEEVAVEPEVKALEPNMLYTASSTWNKEDGSEGSSMGRHIQPTVEVRFVDGAYDVRITPVESSDAMIADLTYGGESLTVVSEEGVSPRQFKMVVDSIDAAIPMGIVVNAGSYGQMSHGVQLVIDQESLAKA